LWAALGEDDRSRETADFGVGGELRVLFEVRGEDVFDVAAGVAG
jgi:hypothetical protein